MVRLPEGYHRRAGGWPAGWVVPAGTHVDRRVLPRSVPPGAFFDRNRRMNVPIGPYGFAQAIIAGFATASGSVTTPAAFQVLVTVTPSGAGGLYTVQWTVALSGSAGAGDANNFRLVQANPLLFLANSVNAGANGTYPQAPVSWQAPPGASLTITCGTAGGSSGAVYTGTIPGEGTSTTVSVGPQGAGSSWDLAQVSVATTTGPNDTSTVAFFAQPTGAVAAPWQVGQSYAGGGDQVGLAGIKLVPGERLYAVWSGGHNGDVATMILTGVQTVLA